MHMLHHISFGVANIERAAAFYDAVLAPLGYVRVWEDLRPGELDQAVGYGRAGEGDNFAIKLRTAGQLAPGPGSHLAFAAPSLEAVRTFHAAALAHGGHDNGAPGLRPDYGPNYYAAFVIDPDGYPIEAVICGAV
jgi:catechol 2,3-dioxygenase-like lactoylglutathione lyase family enzyme